MDQSLQARLKQASAFNVICSTFMLAHLEDPSIKKTLDISELDKAKQVLLDMGGTGETSHEFDRIWW